MDSCRNSCRRRFGKTAGLLKMIISWAVAVLLCSGIFVHPQNKGIYAVFLDVGQGDSIYFEYDEKKFLMDCGSSNISQVAEYRVIPFLKNRGVSTLDAVFVSHGDSDHTNGIIEMLKEGFPNIKEMYVAGNISLDENIVQTAMDCGCKVTYVYAGNTPCEGIKVLAPEKDTDYDDENAASLVLDVHYGEFAMLLTGDSDFFSEGKYISRFGEDDYDLLKVAHHGSRYSTSDELLEASSVKAAVISCYRYNTYGHPHKDTLDRLAEAECEIFRTDTVGAVTVIYRGGETAEIRGFTEE